MTIEEALAILNRNEHRGYRDWKAWEYGGAPQEIYADSQPNNDNFGSLLPMEAIAIAQFYERQAHPVGTLADALAVLGATK